MVCSTLLPDKFRDPSDGLLLWCVYMFGGGKGVLVRKPSMLFKELRLFDFAD